MTPRGRLVGRQHERDRLAGAAERARLGEGALVLLGGEAGVGKTRLSEEVGGAFEGLVLRGAATPGATTAYGPLVAAVRSHLRSSAEDFSALGALRSQLGLILPELGEPPPAGDRPALFEAIRRALQEIARHEPLLLFLDDLQWSDEATLELLSALAAPLNELPVLVVAAYRCDGLARDHGLRRLRHELRRAGQLAEVTLEPLVLEATGALLEQALDGTPSGSLTRTVHDRTQGIPFFIEELARALSIAGSLKQGRRGFELAAHGEVPLPDTIRDAVLIGASELSEHARAAADTAAVAGESFDLDLVAPIAGEEGLGELIASELLIEKAAGQAQFRHALAREAIYADIPWLRRRRLHREIAEALESAGASARLVATHWAGARDSARARTALLRAAEEAEAVHAYRDAAHAGRQALELWPHDEDAADHAHLDALERYARCSALAGDLTEAVRAWREITEMRAFAGDGPALAAAHRRLAAAYDLKGDRESAFATRRIAAEAYATSGLPAEAARDHVAMANHLRLLGHHNAAAELARTAAEEADRGGQLDVRLRACGLEGMASAKAGDHDRGLALVRDALAVAVEHGLTAVAAELYQRLSLVLYDAADYPRAHEALDTALELCRASGESGTEVACVSCLAYVLRERGQWNQATEICRDLAASGDGAFVSDGLLGSIHAFQGRLSSGRRLLSSSLAVSSRLGHYNMTVDSTAALAYIAATDGALDEAAGHCRTLLARWEESDDHHYALSGLRWAGAFFARSGDRRAAHRCIESLSAIASRTGHAEAVAAVAHAIAESALLDGDVDTAADQLTHAVALHRTLDMPFVRAQIEFRCGVALAAAGEREPALERLCDAYRTARKLGARPLATEVAGEVSALGDSVARRLGSGPRAQAVPAGLSRREQEVMRLLAVGRTNREIAQELFLSVRTVDMHVRNILRKLDCRSRVEAAQRAGELGLLV